MTMLTRAGWLLSVVALGVACTPDNESTTSADGSQIGQSESSAVVPNNPPPATDTPLSIEPSSTPGVCSPDLYPEVSAGKVCGTLEFGPLAPVDAYAYESAGAGGISASGLGSASWVSRELTIVFSETRNECEFLNRGVAPSKRNRLQVDLITQSGNLDDPNNTHRTADRIEAGTYVNAGKRNAGPKEIYEIRFRAQTGEGCNPRAEGVTYGPGKGELVDSYASGTVTIHERTKTSVSGVIDAADSLGHYVKIEFTAPICGKGSYELQTKCCAPGQSD